MNHKTKITFILGIAILLANGPLRAQDSCKPATAPVAEVWLNFFVHGIMSIKPHLSLGNFLRLMRDDVENTTYSRAVKIMRENNHFYKNQAMQGFGCARINKTNTDPGHACGALANILDELTLYTDGPHIESHYYTYGWSGLLSPSCRYKESLELFKAIDKEVNHYLSLGITPKIRVVGYSHGGNVVLNLGGIRQKEPVNKGLVIDETVLLGTPIQSETDYLINDSLFKKIYNIYSTGDRVQKLDFFSFGRFFSQRVFKERSGFTLPSKLVQIQLKITRNTPKSRACPKKLANTYNFNNPAVVSGKSHLLKDSSPGHAELWFFGWTPVHYRKTFALNPLPTVAILPLILKTVKEFEHLFCPLDPVIVDMRPEHGITLLKNVRKEKFYEVVDFM
ncbi:MAG: hypothetical protein P4L31_05650, partial [Candidatus Babeliales bacterium]|nr:hypothetical protein [Candidatus Babeliales bacterium]